MHSSRRCSTREEWPEVSLIVFVATFSIGVVSSATMLDDQLEVERTSEWISSCLVENVVTSQSTDIKNLRRLPGKEGAAPDNCTYGQCHASF